VTRDFKVNNRNQKVFDKIHELEMLEISLIQSLNLKNQVIGLCHGVFDVLHEGHFRHINKAKDLCDFLIVSLTSDDFVNKGPGRPINSLYSRAYQIASLANVDLVVLNNDETAVPVLNKIKPNLYFKGSDYNVTSNLGEADTSGNLQREINELDKHNGKLIFTNEKCHSSSSIIQEMNLLNVNKDFKEFIRLLKSKYSLEEIFFYLDEIQKLKVLIYGDTIFDEFIDCDALGKSAKNPLVAFREVSRDVQAGGVLAVAKTISNLIGEENTTVVTYLNEEDVIELKSLNYPINILSPLIISRSEKVTTRKIRYIDRLSGTFVFEKYILHDSTLPFNRIEKSTKFLESTISNFDTLLVTDFGHGEVLPKIVNFAISKNLFVAINCQLNAGNGGRNSIQRFHDFNLATLNGSELDVEIRQDHLALPIKAAELHSKLNVESLVVTNGSKGIVLTNSLMQINSPASFDASGLIKDRIGAGDAVFSISSLLSRVKCPLEIIGFLADLVVKNNLITRGNNFEVNVHDLKKSVIYLYKGL
jgi:rfaE bifunctional protein nucleotidyltransferase chain/domain